MRVSLEKTFLTNPSGTRAIAALPERFVVESSSLTAAILTFIANDSARMLGTVSEFDERRAVATAWKNRLYILVAERAGD